MTTLWGCPQEQSACNGHFESTCYHPLLLFNGEGDCLAVVRNKGFLYQAASWNNARGVVAKVEFHFGEF